MRIVRNGVNPNMEDVLGVLTDEARIGILIRLADGMRSVGELTEMLENDFSSTSRKLRRLRECGLVNLHANKSNHYYSLSEYITIKFQKKNQMIEIRIHNREDEMIRIIRHRDHLVY